MQTDRQTGDLISLLSFLESRLKKRLGEFNHQHHQKIMYQNITVKIHENYLLPLYGFSVLLMVGLLLWYYTH
jgi:hypothetical protein